MSKYLKIWMKSGAFFGIGMGLFYTFQQNNYISGAIGGVIAGFLFGAAMAGFSFASDRKMKEKGMVTESTSVHQTKSLRISLPIETVEPIILKAILSIPKTKLKNTSGNQFEAKTGMTWKSFGEEILVTLDEDGSSVIARMSSKPSLKTTIVDYGKNIENVHAISSYVEKAFEGEVSDCT
ncbi:MAG: hypothetical protein R3E50_12660 [Halioglobus sp.]